MLVSVLSAVPRESSPVKVASPSEFIDQDHKAASNARAREFTDQ